MSRYVRLVDPSDTMDTAARIFDLSDGSLIDHKPIGLLNGQEVWSAEALLCTIDSLSECGKLLYITGCPGDWDEDPEPIPEAKE